MYDSVRPARMVRQIPTNIDAEATTALTEADLTASSLSRRYDHATTLRCVESSPLLCAPLSEPSQGVDRAAIIRPQIAQRIA